MQSRESLDLAFKELDLESLDRARRTVSEACVESELGVGIHFFAEARRRIAKEHVRLVLENPYQHFATLHARKPSDFLHVDEEGVIEKHICAILQFYDTEARLASSDLCEFSRLFPEQKPNHEMLVEECITKRRFTK